LRFQIEISFGVSDCGVITIIAGRGPAALSLRAAPCYFPRMNDQDRTEFLDLLARTREEFLSTLTGVSDEQSRVKPAADAWSILECAEHVVNAERGMLIMIKSRCTPRTAPSPNRDAELKRVVLDRTRKQTAPDAVRPVGRYMTLAQAAEKFREHRSNTIEFVTVCHDDLNAMEVQHPVGGTVTARECLTILALHPSRHAAQVREIRQKLGIT
jgi:uncharacterized damage-inducible protein DinB